jgi:hypothetical protein
VALAVTLGLLSTQALASTWYRYVDEQGVPHISHFVPPEHVHRGYEVLNADGRVIRVVERQLSESEIAEREAEQRRVEEAELARQARLRRDRELMTLYASPEDVEQARDRALARLQSAIESGKASVQRLQDHRRQLEQNAAARERAGNRVSRELLENIRIVEMQIREAERDIEARRAEQQQVREQYDQDMRRVSELYGVNGGAARQGGAG